MRIYLRDHQDSGWKSVLEACFSLKDEDYGADDNWAKFSANPDLDFESSSFKKADALIFVHCEADQKPNWVALISNSELSGHVVFVRSGGWEVRDGLTHAHLHACYWAPKEFKEQNKPEVRLFIESVREGFPKWEFLQPTSVPIEVFTYALLIHTGEEEVARELREAAIREFNERRKALKALRNGDKRYAMLDWAQLENALPENAISGNIVRPFRTLIEGLREDL
jgi:hypothetical protein